MLFQRISHQMRSIMKLSVVLLLCALRSLSQAQESDNNCVCELQNIEPLFPHDKLSAVERSAAECTRIVTPQQSKDMDTLLVGLERRLPQLEAMVAQLELEDDGGLYGAVSLQVIENEMTEVLLLISKLNTTTRTYQNLHTAMDKQMEELTQEMAELKAYDTMQVVNRQQLNSRLKRELDQCKTQNGHHTTAPPPKPGHGNHLRNVTDAQFHSLTEYGTSYTYGGWGQDPKPAAGKESWYWLVPLTSSNVYSNFIRRYSSLSALIVGVSSPGTVTIAATNPTTNTIEGPNNIMYGEALYYACYYRAAVCRFDLTTKSISSVDLAKDTGFHNKYPYCHLGACYIYTDLDLATDESGVWVIYSTTSNYGNLVLSEVIPSNPPTLGRSWNTTAHKRAVTNAFVARGVLYGTRYVSTTMEEIFYSFDTATGVERFDVGILIQKASKSPNIMSLNYSPVDQALHVYSDSYIVSYQTMFG